MTMDRPGDIGFQEMPNGPDDPYQLYRLGVACQADNDSDRARAYFESAVSLNKYLIEAHFRLAVLYTEGGQLEEAIAAYRTCICIEPGLSAAYNNLGLILKTKGQIDGAVACFRKGIEVDPFFSQAYTNLATVYQVRGQLDLALQFNSKAVAVCDTDDVAWYNLGLVRLELGQPEVAIRCFLEATNLRPDFSEAQNNLGVALKKCGRTENAIRLFKNTVEKDPANSQLLYNLGKLLQDVCDWRSLEKVFQTIDQQTRQSIEKKCHVVEEPFFNLARSQDLELNFHVARSHSIKIEKRFQSAKKRYVTSRINHSAAKITVGYLSDGFKNHPTAHLMADVFRLHDRRKFNVNAYSYGLDDQSVYRQSIEDGCDQFVDIADLTACQAAQRVVADRVDILVDLKGHTSNSRLGICAMRPAPVQVRYMGMAGTTGATFFDYIVTDRIVTPLDHSPYYSEKIVHMPNSYQVNSPKSVAADPAFKNRERMGLPADGTIFAAFLAGYKIDRQLFHRWMAILKRVPGSILWLWKRDSVFKKNIVREAKKMDLDPQRIIFAKEMPKPEHLARLGLVDLCLDTRMVNGAATTSDALWAGVPVITILGNHFASRMSASILTAVGLPELITQNLEEYEALAVKLATHPEKLERLRAKLDRNRHAEPLFDTTRFVGNLENAFEQMWGLYLAGEAPRHINVQDGFLTQSSIGSGRGTTRKDLQS